MNTNYTCMYSNYIALHIPASVKFDADAIQKSQKDLAEQAGASEFTSRRKKSPLEQLSVEEMVGRIFQQQRRNLDEWCFLEHYAPEVMLQMLRNAAYELRTVDTYFHQRDKSLAIVLHNPQDNSMKSQQAWTRWLHADVGFRNYLELVAGMLHSLPLTNYKLLY